MRTSVDRSTHTANAAGNHSTAHGFAFIRAVVTRVDTTASTDRNATTVKVTTPYIFPHAEPFTQPDMHSAAPAPMPDLTWLTYCGECATGHCGTCYARWGDGWWCPCPCFVWLSRITEGEPV